MHPICSKCNIHPCSFKGLVVKDAIQVCQFIPIRSGYEYVQSLTDEEKHTIVGERPELRPRPLDTNRSKYIAGKALGGEYKDRLLMN